MVLSEKPVVDDLSALSQRVGPGIDEGFVFEMFESPPLDGVNRQQGAFQTSATIIDDLIRVQQVFSNPDSDIVLERIGPERMLVDMPPREFRKHRFKHFRIVHPPGNPVEIQ